MVIAWTIQIGPSGGADSITAWATVALGALTAVLAGIGIYQARLTGRALRAADRDTREATKARIDQSAPRVVFVAEQESAHEGDWLVELQPDSHLMVPNQAGQAFALSGWFFLINDGKSTANVRVPDGVLLWTPGTQQVTSLRELHERWGANPRPGEERVFTIGPGERQRLFAEFRRELRYWADGCPMSLDGTDQVVGTPRWHSIDIRVDDTFEDGISDKTKLSFQGEPFVRLDEGRYRSNPSNSHLRVERTVRTYPSLPPPAK